MRSFVPQLLTALFFVIPTADSAQDFSQLAERTRPAVVMLEIVDTGGSVVSSGTGFLVDPSGIIATNYHVIEGAARVRVRYSTHEDEVLKGFLAVDRNRDLALLKADRAPRTALSLGAFSQVRQGQRVIVFGNPLGLEGVISQGIVSALRDGDAIPKRFEGELKHMPEMQLTAAISPGSSGSPVLDLDGHVIGIAVIKLFGGDNLNFAIAVDHLEELLDRAPAETTSFPSANRRWINLAISVVLLSIVGLSFRWVRKQSQE